MKQTLHIGDEVKVIKTEEIVTVKSISTYSNGKRIKGFYDEKHRYWSFLLDQLQLIKPKTKKVKCYLTKKQINILIDAIDCYTDEYHDIPEKITNKLQWYLEDLLATQPKPIKEEIIPRFKDMPGWNKCADKVESLVKHKQEESKEIEGTDVGIGTVFGAEGEKINSLIRNQKKIINSLTKRNIK